MREITMVNHPYKSESYHDTAQKALPWRLRQVLEEHNMFTQFEPAWAFLESLRQSGYKPSSAAGALKHQYPLLKQIWEIS